MKNGELTMLQENLICDLPYHDKKLTGDIDKEKKEYKMFPVNPKHIDQILKKIGRRKL